MKKWFRLNIIVPALLGVVGIALVAVAGSDTFFQATGTVTTTDSHTEITQTEIHMTSGDDRIDTHHGDDRFDMGSGDDYIDLGAGSDPSEINRLIFNADNDDPTEGESGLTEIYYDESDDNMEFRVNSGDFIIKFGS